MLLGALILVFELRASRALAEPWLRQAEKGNDPIRIGTKFVDLR